MNNSDGLPGADAIRRKLRQYDRSPFLDLLAIWMENAPTEDDIRALAQKYPERWVTAITQIARTAGFTEKMEVDHNINITIGEMSDSQLEDRVRALAREMAIAEGLIIDLQPEDSFVVKDYDPNDPLFDTNPKGDEVAR